MSFEIEMILNCKCDVSDSVNIDMNDSYESSIVDEINSQSNKFTGSQVHPDEVHITCLKCGEIFNLGT